MVYELSPDVKEKLDTTPWSSCRIALSGTHKVLRAWLCDRALEEVVGGASSAEDFVDRFRFEFREVHMERNWGMTYRTAREEGLYVPLPRVLFLYPKDSQRILDEPGLLETRLPTEPQCNFFDIHDFRCAGHRFHDSVDAAKRLGVEVRYVEELDGLRKEAKRLRSAIEEYPNWQRCTASQDKVQVAQFAKALEDESLLRAYGRLCRIGWYEDVWSGLDRACPRLDRTNPVHALALHYSSVLGGEPEFFKELSADSE